MALWIQNVTPDIEARNRSGEAHDYEVKVNNHPPLATFKHDPVLGAAECLRAAADAIDLANGVSLISPAGEVVCSGCEGNPVAPNIPCAVCGAAPRGMEG